jgi:hypothetical protein
MVWAFAEICDTQRAAAVVRSMYNAGRDPRLGAQRLWSPHASAARVAAGALCVSAWRSLDPSIQFLTLAG